MTRVRLTVVVAWVVLLAGCSVPPTRPGPPHTPTPPLVAPAPPAAPEAIAPVADTAHAAAPVSPWQRLRGRFAMQGCDYRPEVQRRARHYAKSPQRFAASWKAAMPFLLLVVDELDRRGLPGEFAMLPYVESGYRPLPARGNLPAGMWQLMPATARAAGLTVGTGYDARLDATASTRAALDLIERYDREFADWRLADMAFNSGEYRVRKLLGQGDARNLSAGELAKLPLSQTTHQHLDRLLALSCIIEDPARFGVVLPEPDAGDRLQRIGLDSGMDLRLAARLAGVALDDMKRWNAGYRRSRMNPDAPFALLMPAVITARFSDGAAAVPAALWNDWREERAARTGRIGSWAIQANVPVAVLALANGIDEHALVTPGSRLLLPGREKPSIDQAEETASVRAGTHVVVSGDTLSAIARRYSISQRELRRLNPRAMGTLHLGDTLRLGASTD